MKLVLVAALFALLAVGCGKSKTDPLTESAVQYRLANCEANLADATLNGGNLSSLTEDYVLAIRAAAEYLPADELSARVSDEARFIAQYCRPCADTLGREIERLS